MTLFATACRHSIIGRRGQRYPSLTACRSKLPNAVEMGRASRAECLLPRQQQRQGSNYKLHEDSSRAQCYQHRMTAEAEISARHSDALRATAKMMIHFQA